MPFDQVKYCGEKLRSELGGSLGTICARVNGSDSSYVVDFGKDAYVLHESLLTRFTPNTKEEVAKAEFEIYKRRSKKHSDDE
jgi:hypothetical protein